MILSYSCLFFGHHKQQMTTPM